MNDDANGPSAPVGAGSEQLRWIWVVDEDGNRFPARIRPSDWSGVYGSVEQLRARKEGEVPPSAPPKRA